MRFEETEKYAEIIHKYECIFGRTPKSLVYTEYSKLVSLTGGVTYRVTLHDEAYILSSLCTSNTLGLNPLMGFSAVFNTLRNLDYEGFASNFSLLLTSSLTCTIFVSYYKPIW